MAKVEQKVVMNNTQYRKGARELASDTRKTTDKISESFNDAGNKSRDFTERVQKNNKKAKGSFEDLFKGIKGGLGFLSAAGAGAAVAGIAIKGVKEALSLSETLNRVAVRTGQTPFQQGQFKEQILDVSGRADVDAEVVAAAALNAINMKASADEAIKFAEVIAKTAQAFEDVDPSAFSEQIARDLRARGQDVTADAARKSIEALLVGTRQGLGGIEDAFQAVSAVPGRVQERAGLSQRELVNLFAGAQGVQADPGLVNEAIRNLISATDNIESAAATQGILGTQLRDSQGNFNLTIDNLDAIAKNLEGIGTEQQQRAVLEQIPGFNADAVEGILALVKDRAGFQRQRELAARDQPKLDDAFEQSTKGITSQISRFFNQIVNEFSREQKVEFNPLGAAFGRPLALKRAENTGSRELSALATPQQREAAAQAAAVGPPLPPPVSTQQNVKVTVEVDSKDPGFIGNPKSTDLATNPGGF